MTGDFTALVKLLTMIAIRELEEEKKCAVGFTVELDKGSITNLRFATEKDAVNYVDRMRRAGLASHADECAQQGKDWKDVLEQRKREKEVKRRIAKRVKEATPKDLAERKFPPGWEVAGFEGLYSVTPEGRIWSHLEGETGFIRPDVGADGRARVLLKNRDGTAAIALVDRCVAFAHVPNPNHHNFIRHQNGIKADDRAFNLQWVASERETKNERERRKENAALVAKKPKATKRKKAAK